MEMMNLAVCDDDRVFLDELEREIKRYTAEQELDIHIDKYSAPRALLSADLASCDAVFLDIDMPEINGLEVAQQLRNIYPDIVIVFVTGWIEYAPAGYRVNAFRYLLKKNLSQELWNCLDDVQKKLAEVSEQITIHTRDRTLEVGLNNILYFEGTSHRSVLMHTKHQKLIECTGKLSDYEAALSVKGFLRLQKSYLVNMNHIEKIRNYRATLQNGEELKVSERQYALITKDFLMWKGKIS
jgi:DNA-binding LytR/AlgR family response regulator